MHWKMNGLAGLILPHHRVWKGFVAVMPHGIQYQASVTGNLRIRSCTVQAKSTMLQRCTTITQVPGTRGAGCPSCSASMSLR